MLADPKVIQIMDKVLADCDHRWHYQDNSFGRRCLSCGVVQSAIEAVGYA